MNTIEFKGMTRATSSQNNPDGTGEEIINLRQDAGAWRVVGKKKLVLEKAPYEQVYVHEYSVFKNYIGVIGDRVVWFDENGEKQEICKVKGSVEFKHIGNVLIIKDTEFIRKSIFLDNKKYSHATAGLPEMVEFTHSVIQNPQSKGGTSAPNRSDDKDLQLAQINGDFNKKKKEFEKQGWFEGYMFIRLSYKLFDGTESMNTPPLLVRVGYDHLKIYYLRTEGDKDLYSIDDIRSGKVSLTFPNAAHIKDAYGEIISGVCVYSSPVLSYADTMNASLNDEDRFFDFKRDISRDFNNLAYYKIKSIPLNELCVPNKDKTIEITYDDIKDITTNEDITVTASQDEATGDMFVYNNRLHLFNLKRKLMDFTRRAYFIKPFVEHSKFYGCVVLFELYHRNSTKYVVAAEGDGLFGYDTDNYIVNVPEIISFPDSRVRKVHFGFKQGGVIKSVVNFEMQPSKKYNFSYAFTRKYDPADPSYFDKYLKIPVDGAVVEDIVLTEDSNKLYDLNNIIVSAPSNPYYFPVEHSYSTPAEVVGLAVSTEQISESQVGQFPLYLFTKEGVYSLQVGDGQVLYSNLVPISSEVATGSLLQTRTGVVFAASDGLKLISGREVVDLSEAIEGEPDKYMRAGADYVVADHDLSYHIRPCLSACRFSEYIQGACVVGYDISRDELIVSNDNFAYSYVFSLKTKTWHKITEVFSRFDRGMGFYTHKVVTPTEPPVDPEVQESLLTDGVYCNVYDIRAEDPAEMVVHLQTRPILFNHPGFKKLNRFVLRGDLRPTQEGALIHGIRVFASPDFVNWKCISSREFRVDTAVAPTGIAMGSHKAFVILVGGVVRPGYNIAYAEADVENVFDNKLR